MSHFIGIYENAAPLDYCERMVAKFKELATSHSIAPDYGQYANGGIQNRKDTAFYFERDAKDLAQETNALLDAVLHQYLEDHVGLARSGIYSKCIKVQETKRGGGFHSWHNELGYGDSAGRMLTWSIYLNTLPEGEGETEFIEQGLRVRPEAGKIVLFPTAWTHTHRGNPPYTENKYFATGWYYLAE